MNKECEKLAEFYRHLRIHGDNILECERAMRLLVEALDGTSIWLNSSPYCPEYKIVTSRGDYNVRLFPGYKGRWSFNIQEYLRSVGAPLKEATDAVITELKLDSKGKPEEEKVLLAIEFCGALPAGNNAWQRCGRAIAAAKAGIPYLYYAELGGFELDANRRKKAARLPNPLVPFGYLNLGRQTGTPILPCFTPSPSITKEFRELYKECFGETEAVEFIRQLITGGDTRQPNEAIEQKAERTLGILSRARKKRDSLTGEKWIELSEARTSQAAIEMLIGYAMPWAKSTSIATTPTFQHLAEASIKCGAVAAGSSVMPICILPEKARTSFADVINTTYGKRISKEFLEWLKKKDGPLALVWIAGFKPRGDDSRPDRGLVPLARMALGFEINLLSIVYGPAKAATWSQLESRPEVLLESNGLWEAMLCLGDAVLIDSMTETGQLSSVGVVCSEFRNERRLRIASKFASTTPIFGEHDVDTVLHNFFNLSGVTDFMEGMCNPPGGDWSGMSYFDVKAQVEYRWTSLPRVSGTDSKRPDHIALLLRPLAIEPIIIVTESKDKANDVEPNIGPRLIKYVKDLHAIDPNISRKIDSEDSQWEHSSTKVDFSRAIYISASAYRYDVRSDIYAIASYANTDMTIAVEFNSEQESVILHIVLQPAARLLVSFLERAAQGFNGRIKVKIY
jgi:hypothetical protein